MSQQNSQAYYTREQRFKERFPFCIVAILSIVQMLVTFAILAFELAHVLISIRLTNLFAGFWASVPFTVLWISMFAAVCCCRRRSCASHAVAQNIISFLFACALVGINIAFLRQPYRCFFTKEICDRLNWNNLIDIQHECFGNDSSESCNQARISLIKAQLAAGVIMAVTCLIYLILYFIFISRISKAPRQPIQSAPEAVMASNFYQPVSTSIYYQADPYTYTVAPNPYQPSAPGMIPSETSIQYGHESMNYLPPNQYPAMYPTISNERF